jgi:hypothetical protein
LSSRSLPHPPREYPAASVAPVIAPVAFSSEVDTGSREENASKQQPEFRF